MLLKVTPGGVPPGNYQAKFEGVEPTENDKYGKGWRWKFAITSGPLAKQTVSRVTGLTPSLKNGCGKMLSGLSGHPLQLDEEVDPDQYIGRSYLIVVIACDTGGSRVETVIATEVTNSLTK